METLNLLIVEDELIVAKSLKHMLEELGYGVSGMVDSAEEAIRETEKQRPDLVLMDIVLNGEINGIEAAEQIRSRFGTPVIYLTAYSDQTILAQAKVTEPFGYLIKPFGERELNANIQMAIYKAKKEAKLRESEKRYRSLFEQSNDAILIHDLEGGILDANTRACEMLGYECKDLHRMFLPMIYADDERMVFENSLCEIREKGHARFESRLRRADGTTIAVEISARITDEEGVTVQEIIRDITERKKMEEAFQSEYAFRKAIESSMLAGVATVDLTGRQTYVNPAFCKMVGWTENELVGKRPPFVFWAPEQRERTHDGLMKKVRGEEPTGSFELRFQRRNGELFDVLGIHSPLADAEGNVTGWLAVFYDITDRKRAEATLLESERRFREMLSNLKLIAVILDSKGNITFANDYLLELMGYKREEVLGKDWIENFIPAELRHEIRQWFSEIISLEKEWSYHENEILTRQGERRLIAWNNTALRDPQGHIIASASIGEDITDRKRFEEETLKVRKLESISTLAGGIAHDFNNLLQAIMANISIAKFHLFPDDNSFKRLTAAEDACQQAAELSYRLITFARGGKPVKKRMPISEVFDESVLLSSVGPNITCELLLANELSPVEIDERQIKQVIRSILKNAKEAMPEGGIIKVSANSVRVTEKDNLQLEEGNYLKISIQDQGVGIPEENLSKIFDPYFTTKHMGADRGLGLGLAICHSIVSKHDGRIAVESKLGSGTTFHIYLPVS